MFGSFLVPLLKYPTRGVPASGPVLAFGTSSNRTKLLMCAWPLLFGRNSARSVTGTPVKGDPARVTDACTCAVSGSRSGTCTSFTDRPRTRGYRSYLSTDTTRVALSVGGGGGQDIGRGAFAFDAFPTCDALRVVAPRIDMAGAPQPPPPPGTGRSTATATLADSAAVPRYATATIVPVCVTPVLSAGVVFWRVVTHRLSPPAQSTANGPTRELSCGVHTHDWTATGRIPSPRRAVNLT